MLSNFLNGIKKSISSLWERNENRKSDAELILPPQVYVGKKAGSLSRAVFANRHFEAGEVIEKCPVMIIEAPIDEVTEQIRRIAFNWEILAATYPSSAIALGFGCFYNHADLPNVNYVASEDKSLLIFTTACAVQKGQELTIDYRKDGGRLLVESELEQITAGS